MNHKITNLLFSLFLLLSINSVFGFSCNSPSNDQEKFICSNQSLSTLNSQSTQLEQKVSSVKPDVSREISQSLYFDLRKCENDVDCLTNSYNSSISSFTKVIQDSPQEFSIQTPLVQSASDKSGSNQTNNEQQKSNLDIVRVVKGVSILGILLLTLLTPILYFVKKFSQTKKNGYIKVQQSFQLIAYVIWTLLIIFILFLCSLLFQPANCNFGCSVTPENSNFVFITSFIVMLVWSLFWYQYRLGYVVNTNTQTLSFKNSFLTRKTIDISQISSVEQKQEFYEHRKKDGSIETGYHYFINLLMKDHTPYRLIFDSDLESDQFYQVLNSVD